MGYYKQFYLYNISYFVNSINNGWQVSRVTAQLGFAAGLVHASQLPTLAAELNFRHPKNCIIFKIIVLKVLWNIRMAKIAYF